MLPAVHLKAQATVKRDGASRLAAELSRWAAKLGDSNAIRYYNKIGTQQ